EAPKSESSSPETTSVVSTTCCIVGGGPAGVMLGYLLARRRIPVILLEAHKGFDREFPGDTLHPSVLRILEQVGFADKPPQLPHAKVHNATVAAANGPFTPIDFRRLKTRFPYIMLIPQPRFLEFMTVEARRFPQFQVLMGANVQRLIEEDGVVHGVRYRDD